MFSKSALVTLCLAFFVTSLTLLIAPSRAAADSAPSSSQPITVVAEAATPILSHMAVVGSDPIQRAAALPTLHRAPIGWGLWSKALERTRQLLWMLTRQDRLLRLGVELV